MSGDTSTTIGRAAAELLPIETIRRLLLWVALFFCVAGLLSELSKYLWLGYRHDLAERFSLSYEENFPTWYAACQLFLCGAVLVGIAMLQRRSGARYIAHWWGLGLLFFYISVDEMLSFHEFAGGLVEAGGGVLYFDWIIPAAAVVAVIGFLYLRFLWHLPAPTRNQFIAAGAIFVCGAMGMELPLGYWKDMYGDGNLGYGIIDMIEETMELMGVALFLTANVEFFMDRVRERWSEGGGKFAGTGAAGS